MCANLWSIFSLDGYHEIPKLAFTIPMLIEPAREAAVQLYRWKSKHVSPLTRAPPNITSLASHECGTCGVHGHGLRLPLDGAARVGRGPGGREYVVADPPPPPPPSLPPALPSRYIVYYWSLFALFWGFDVRQMKWLPGGSTICGRRPPPIKAKPDLF
jgi:hypothetical protein